MTKQASKPKLLRPRNFLWGVGFYVCLVYSITAITPAPKAVSIDFAPKTAKNVSLLADLSWIDPNGQRQLEQQIFDAILEMIESAERFILVDMFLFNDWQGPVSETHRALSSEMTEALIAAIKRQPTMSITVISDPVNDVYGGLPSKHFTALEQAGIAVVRTDLTELQDSNKLYSGIWRWLIKPFGNAEGAALPNPFGPGRVSVRSYLALLNFKANHRKLIVADGPGGELQAIVSSANPHDGSSAHRNVAVSFGGDAVIDLLWSEKQLIEMSDASVVLGNWPVELRGRLDMHAKAMQLTNEDVVSEQAENAFTVEVVNESGIEDAAIDMLKDSDAGDQVDLLMFYLSDRDIVDALIDAHKRGVQVRVLLDVNQDAFGRTKNGVPNRPVAAALVEQGVPVRWCTTGGEQCHAKMLFATNGSAARLLLGSGNYTRRNLENYNLETDVLISAPGTEQVMIDAAKLFSDQWSNHTGRTYSVEYGQYAEESWLLGAQYRLMEASGIGTF